MKIKCSLSSFDLFDLWVTFKRVKLSSNRPKMFKTYSTYVLCRNFSFYTCCNSLGVFALRGDPTISNWRTNTMICQDYTMRPTNCGCIFILFTWKLCFFVWLWQKELNSINVIGQEHSAVKSPFIIEIIVFRSIDTVVPLHFSQNVLCFVVGS